ncbi:MAG: PepSY domain-containing protein [bacterium]
MLSFVVAQSCQQAQIRVTQDQAIATAKQEIAFTPKGTQVRMLRQGLNRQPFWIVSLSVPNAKRPGTFRRLALVHIDANTGEVTEVQQDEVVPEKGS